MKAGEEKFEDGKNLKNSGNGRKEKVTEWKISGSC